MSMPNAMVMLGKGAKLSLAEVQHHFISSWPRLPRPVNSQKTDHTISFTVAGSTVFFGLIPGPIPDKDLGRICAESWLWPDAKEAFNEHRGHVVISVESVETPLNQVKFLSLATAAMLMACPSALGVFWCGGNLVVSPEMFREFCVRMLPDSLPLYIWVDFRVSQKNGRTIGYTSGLSQFGLMDIETVTSHETITELRERMFTLAVYLIENGMIIKNGQTLGEDERDQIKAVYSDSAFGNPKKVLRLDFESAEKAKGKH
jgi:hypothetical protein